MESPNASGAVDGTVSGVSTARSAFEMLRDSYAREPNRVLLRRRDRGLWVDISTAEVANRVAQLVGELESEGVRARTLVAVELDVGFDWICCDLALEAIGACAVYAIPPDRNGSAEVEIIVAGPSTAARSHHRTAQVVVLSDNVPHAGQVAELPNMTTTPGSRQFASSMKGQSTPIDSRHLIDDWLPFVGSSAGTTDRTLAQTARPGRLDWACVVLAPLTAGAIGHLPDWNESVDDAFHDVAPTLVVCPAAEWASIAAAIEAAVASSGWLKRASFRAACSIVPVDAVTTRILRSRVGLGSTRRALSYGALDEKVASKWRRWRLPIEAILLDPMVPADHLTIDSTSLSGGGGATPSSSTATCEPRRAEPAIRSNPR